MDQLQDKVAIVFGASRGIGKSTAERLASEGASVVLASRDTTACEDAVRDIIDGGGIAAALSADVTDYVSVQTAVEMAISQFGALDIVINNAGTIEPIDRLADCDVNAWANNMAVNVVGVLHGCRASLPKMLLQGHGVIINVSSGAASNPRQGWSAYCAAKAAVAMLTRSLHLEYGAEGIRAFGFRPGLVDTAMQDRIRQSGVNEVSQIPQTSLIPPTEPAAAIAWLCSDAAADLAGGELDIRDPDLRRRAGL
jgi:3-oxoacyl-[acyl-carrier protein] reductase